jgi:probable rRNA maturation factor
MSATMEPLVDTVIEDPRWEGIDLAARAEAAAQATLTAVGLAPAGFSIVVMGCDDARIAALNADFRGKPAATNVLSWPSEERGAGQPGAVPDMPEAGLADEPTELGDIALAFETCAREAAAQGKSLEAHASHLVAHAVLHLLGYDHEGDEDADLMEKTEVRALANLGIANPYL